MAKTAQDFYNTYNGKVIDYDGAYGEQCVDAFKVFCEWAGIPVKATPNNWADGYWYYKDQLGYAAYFDYITDNNLRTGDWVIWAKGSNSHKSSHIAMYYVKDGIVYEFGENQGGNGGFCLKETVFSDALGALRWKGFNTTMNLEYGYTKHVFNTAHGNVIVSAVRGDLSKGYDLHMITADGANKLQNIDAFDSDKLLILGGVNGNYFQMSDGRHLGVEGDGTVLGYSQEPKQPQWLAIYQKDGKLGDPITANDYWYRQDEIDFVCSPYSTRVINGIQAIKYSEACNDKDDLLNEQTAAIKFSNGDWAIAIFEKCYPRDVQAWALQFNGCDFVMLMDSGGSTQMFECTSGTRQIVRNTGRKISDTLVIGKKINPVPDTGDNDKYKALYEECKAENDKLLRENADLKIKIANAISALS